MTIKTYIYTTTMEKPFSTFHICSWICYYIIIHNQHLYIALNAVVILRLVIIQAGAAALQLRTCNIIGIHNIISRNMTVNDALKKRGIPYTQTTDLEQVIGDLDILYMTRVQRERFFNEEDYLRLKDSYILDAAKLRRARRDLCVMHPLPRVNEIAVEVDDDPRACYFKQVLYGKYMRMALIMMLLEVKA